MLNLSFMFSGKPAPVVGGRKVLGYAMSGSRCAARKVVSDDAIKANPAHAQKALNEQAVLSAMKTEMAYSIGQLVNMSGVSKTSCRDAVARLIEDEAIKRIPGLHCSFYMLA